MIVRIIKSMLNAVGDECKKIQKEKDQRRLYKIWSTKWNSDIEWIQSQMDYDKSSPQGSFKWRQLVMQEIEMWSMIAKKFPMKEIDLLVDIRGFNETQKQYLIDHAKLMGLLISEEEFNEIEKKRLGYDYNMKMEIAEGEIKCS